MTTSLSRNLKLRINSNLTADARYNLERLDLLGGTFVNDTTDTLRIRSQGDITIEPEAADIGGSGTGGSLSIGTSDHLLTSFSVYASTLNLSGAAGLLDQATSGTKYLRLQYKSDLNGSVDTTADRALSVDLDGADRNLVLGGNLSVTGGSLTLALSGTTSLTLPTTGTLSTLAGAETLTNKTISGASNTLTVRLANDVTGTLPVANGGTGGTTPTAALTNLLPSQTGNTSKVLQTDGSTTSWAAVGVGSVTSVALTVPSSILSVAGSPITSSGTLALSLATQVANTIWAGPSTGADAAPTFRALVLADIPAGIPAANIGGGAVNDTEFSYLDGVTSAIQTQLNAKQTLDSDLTALAGLSSTGLIVRTGSGTATTRTITAGTGISVTDGDGVSANPTVTNTAPDQTVVLTAGTNIQITGTYPSFTITNTAGTYSDEQAQDAIGNILLDTASVDFSYDDTTPTISAVVLPAGVDHNSLANFVANKHIDHGAVQIATAATSGLSGGGDITTTRNLLVDPTRATAASPAAADVLLFADASNSNALAKCTVQEVLDLGGGKFTATWSTGDGTTKAVTHSFAVTTVSVTVFDIDSGEDILVDSIVRTNTNTVTLTSSSAPTGSGWTVIVRK